MPRDEFNPDKEWPPKEGWRTIDTAPKDGREMLLYVNGGSGDREYFGVGQWATKKEAGTVAGWFWSYAIRPTHWIPLPDPPRALGLIVTARTHLDDDASKKVPNG